MDGFDTTDFDTGLDLQPEHSCCQESLTQDLAVALIAQGMDPGAAVLQAQLDAPLIEPFLF